MHPIHFKPGTPVCSVMMPEIAVLQKYITFRQNYFVILRINKTLTAFDKNDNIRIVSLMKGVILSITDIMPAAMGKHKKLPV
jgi:hypothetical protein